VSTAERADLPAALRDDPAPPADLDPRALELYARVDTRGHRRRGWLVVRLLLLADVVGLSLAFLVAQLLVGEEQRGSVSFGGEFLVFFLTLPGWILFAKLYELYDHDEERTDHTTVDDLFRVFQLVTVGVWLLMVGTWATGVAEPNLPKLVVFWALAVALVTACRAGARVLARRSVVYVQNTVIVGAGEVGQLVARKILQHPEYRINLIGFVDSEPRELRDELADLPVLGRPAHLSALVRLFDVERVVLAFSKDSHEEALGLVRSLKGQRVQIDIVPRLFEIVGPNVGVHSVEGLPLVSLPTSKPFPFSRTIKRTIDILGACVGLVVSAPLWAYIAVRVKLDSPGPILFRQTRLGQDMREFTALKFRSMRVDVDQSLHREYIRETMNAAATVGDNGLYKLEQEDAITPFGRWLRKTSLDELPQLVNVLRGEMSLVGPRPCIPYETENFAPHHYERFLVPQGITGLWQVTARSHSTFGEAIEMDVAYARNWSLGLDLALLFKTPFSLLRSRGTT
jgi:exopolysaccharide biosynthesis polyprenyl glycosylphosphotransferase